MTSAKLELPDFPASSGPTWGDYKQVTGITSPDTCALTRSQDSK